MLDSSEIDYIENLISFQIEFLKDSLWYAGSYFSDDIQNSLRTMNYHSNINEDLVYYQIILAFNSPLLFLKFPNDQIIILATNGFQVVHNSDIGTLPLTHGNRKLLAECFHVLPNQLRLKVLIFKIIKVTYLSTVTTWNDQDIQLLRIPGGPDFKEMSNITNAKIIADFNLNPPTGLNCFKSINEYLIFPEVEDEDEDDYHYDYNNDYRLERPPTRGNYIDGNPHPVLG